MVDIQAISLDELNEDLRISHNEKEFCKIAMAAGLREYKGMDLTEQICRTEIVIEIISTELQRRRAKRKAANG